MSETTNDEFLIRPYRKGEEHKRAALANACRTSEKDPIVTIDMIRLEWEDSRLRLNSDTWVALNKEGEYISVAEVWFDDPDNNEAVITRHIGFEMHPAYRQSHRDVMDQLLHQALQHASARPFSCSNQGYVLRIWASATDSWKHEVTLKHGFELSHIGYTMVHNQLDSLPTAPDIPHIRLEDWSPERDLDFWIALNEAFGTESSFKSLDWDEWLKLYHDKRIDQNLWCLAIDEESRDVVGLAIAEIDRQANRESNRQDGWVVDLGVIKAWRNRGIGRALLLNVMQKLDHAGMTAVKMGIDSYDTANATRLYKSVGFKVMHGSHTYLKTLHSSL